jgi:CRP/FNR family transcriptional regulator
LEELARESRRLQVPAASIIHRVGDTRAHLELVVTGLIRVFITAPDGRTMTVRYCRPGALLGAVSLFAQPFWLPASIQPLTDAELLVFSPAVVLATSEANSAVSRALLDELAERVLSFMTEIHGGAFANMRQRVARHLLDLASENQRGRELSVRVTQQSLAEAVGTVREVVARVLGELRREGLLRTEQGQIVINRPEQLAQEVVSVIGSL